jgi:methylenetetrahydrofolate reductase (NADPH)
VTRSRPLTVLHDYSLEITGKDLDALDAAAAFMTAGTRVNVTYLGNENMPIRLKAAKAVREMGFRPVPHVSARRLRSEAEFEQFLTDLAELGASEEIVIVGGDPVRPEGPYADALALIRTGLLGQYGVRRVGITGYPEGHPHISAGKLWQALEDKSAALTEQSIGFTIFTQFGFDVDPVVDWIKAVRERGIDAPVRVGVPGPAGVRRLLRYAKQFGVQSSAGIVAKYGLSLTNLLGTAGPDTFVTNLQERLDPARHGEVALHFYTFGGVRPTAEWVRDARGEVH